MTQAYDPSTVDAAGAASVALPSAGTGYHHGGDPVTDMTGREIRSNLRAVRALVLARSVATYTLPATGWQQVPLPTEDVDDDGVHSTTSNTGRFTFSRPGWYRIGALISWQANQSTSVNLARQCRLNRNGATVPNTLVTNTYAAVGLVQHIPPTPVLIAAGDYVQLDAAGPSGHILFGDPGGAGSMMFADLLRAT